MGCSSSRRDRSLVLRGAALLALAQGCSAEDGGSTTQAAGSGQPAVDAGSCRPQSCACGAGSGVQHCDPAGRLESCDCDAAAILPPPSRDDAAVSSEGSCVTGVYEGNFEGEAGFLIAVGAVSGFDLFGEAPPLQITLEAPPGRNEFEVVGSGTMRGNADGVFPFEATITGMLDCHSRQFTATLTGSVQLVLDGVLNHFTGTMTATYDSERHAFTAGMWTVTGSEADGGTDFGLTGNGTWSADYARDRAADAGP